MKKILDNKGQYCEVKISGNNIQVVVDEGKKQLSNYWIAKVEDDVFGEPEIKGFATKKTNQKTISFLNIEDGDYLVQLGKGSTRTSFSVKNGELI